MNGPIWDEIDESDLDDALLVGRIKNVVMGDVHIDPEGETVEEQSRYILRTIACQLRSGVPSRAALGYLGHCLERHIDGQTASLDEAFYVKHNRAAGGQPIAGEVDRATVRAFMQEIRLSTSTFEPLINDYIYSKPSKLVLRQAYKAAFLAYRDAVGKDNDEFNDPEKKINQTIKPILKRMGVFR